jgi:glycosyltransferase involved in cell wall biosynthesis
MRRIFINGLSANSGGGKSILDNYLTTLNNSNSPSKYYVLTPSKIEYDKFTSKNIEIVEVNQVFNKKEFIPINYKYFLPRLIKSLNIDVIFNLADIPIPISGVRQVFLFDWPYAAYPDSSVWETMDLKSLLLRKIKLFYFKKFLSSVSVMIVQTNTIKTRLERLYGLKNITIVPNAVTLEHTKEALVLDFGLPNGTLLLCLSRYYPHKNFEIFLPLAEEIKRRGLDFKVIITIDESQHQSVKPFLSLIRERGLDQIIFNLGAIDMPDTPSLYEQCDGLLMPTLLETYCLPYVESMYHKRLILTSDMDFSRDVCGDAAIFFDPKNHFSILQAIEKAYSDPILRDEKIRNGSKRIEELNTWDGVTLSYEQILEDTVIYD